MTAVEHVRRRAATDAAAAVDRLAAHSSVVDPGQLVGRLGAARLTVNFHPDRRDRSGRTVAAGLLADDRYHNQFETGISNGQRFTSVDGMRSRWERELFGEVDERERPIYGALDVFGDPHGGSPRFGSCYLVLRPHCLERTTLCVGDSHEGPTDVGTVDQLESIAAGLCDQITVDGFGRGLRLDTLAATLSRDPADATSPARSLDPYIEAQIHGGVRCSTDVEEIVIDPSFRDSPIESDLTELARRHGIGLRWHGGSEMPAAATPTDFRGPAMPTLAHEVARPDGIVDAAAIGRRLDGLPYTAPTPTGDPEEHPLQLYKKLWHCVLRYGADAELID